MPFARSLLAAGRLQTLALETIEAHLRRGERFEVRPRIEHVQQLDPSDIRLFDGVIASMQPLHRADDGRFIEKRVGPARLAGFFAFRSLRNAGATLAFGSDWPIVSCDPMLGVRAAVTGLTADGEFVCQEETIDVECSLLAYGRSERPGVLKHSNARRARQRGVRGLIGQMRI